MTAALLSGSLGLGAAAITVLLALPLILRGDPLVALSGLLIGFGGLWLALLARQVASGGTSSDIDGWILVGAAPLLIGVLALLLGAQASAVKHIGIRDLSTVVVTMTMVNLAGDSRLAGGAGAASFRRVGAIVTMGLGALAAAAVIRYLSGSWALVLAGVLMAAALGLLHRARRTDRRLAEAPAQSRTA